MIVALDVDECVISVMIRTDIDEFLISVSHLRKTSISLITYTQDTGRRVQEGRG